MNILFRADGSQELGMGHIMRSIALAEELKRRKCQVYFMVNLNSQAKRIVDQRGLPRISYESDHSTLSHVLKEKGIDVFVSDVVEYDAQFFSLLKKEGIYSVQLDIERKLTLGVDLLINGGIYAKEMQQEASRRGQSALLGSEYNLLRKEFAEVSAKEYREEIKDVLITLGATDVHNLTEKITLAALDSFEQAQIHVVVGSEKSPFVQQELQENARISLYHQTPHMLQLMEKADIALCSGGVSLYELAACGTPALVITQAQNQIRQTEVFASYNAALYYGRAEDYDEKKYTEFLQNLKDLTLRRQLSSNARKYVDGKGVERVVDYLVSSFSALNNVSCEV